MKKKKKGRLRPVRQRCDVCRRLHRVIYLSLMTTEMIKDNIYKMCLDCWYDNHTWNSMEW